MSKKLKMHGGLDQYGPKRLGSNQKKCENERVKC